MPEWLKEALAAKVGEHEVWRIGVFFLSVLVSLIVGRISQFLMGKSARRSERAGRQFATLLLKTLAKPSVLLLFAAGVWFGTSMLNLTGWLSDVATTVTSVLFAAAIGHACYKLVDIVDHYLSRFAGRTRSKVDDMLVPLVGKSIRITVVVLVLVQVVQSVFQKPITSIIAGLGVGGLAIALAGQETIKNFFGSLVILGDKPFEIGDRIVVDGHDGIVEDVGFRSTRIRRLDGHLVTVPNAEMVNKTVENVGKRPFIRRVATFGVTYDTPPEKVERAVEIVKEILAGHEGMDPEFPPRVYFSEFADFSLNIVVYYWYHPPDYWKYMEFSERVNREILRQFNAEGVEFAFPTQTVFLANDDRRQPAVKVLHDE